jgi:hypothetical protein
MTVNTKSGDEVQVCLEGKEQIAQGGWATIYRAKIAPSGEVIAIKEVKESRQYKVDPSDVFQLSPSIVNWKSCVK